MRVIRFLLISFLLFFPPASFPATFVGFTEEDEKKVNNDLNALIVMGKDTTGSLTTVGLPSNGLGLRRLLESKLPLIIEDSSIIKACSTANHPRKKSVSCDDDYEAWPEIKISKQLTTHSGIRLYTPFIDKISNFSDGMRIAVDKNRLLDVESKNHVILSVSKDVLKSENLFDTPEASSIYRVAGYLSAARVFDAFIQDGRPLEHCEKKTKICDQYRNGPASHAGAFFIYASRACKTCTKKDRAYLLSFGLKTLSIAPPDVLIDPLSLLNAIRKVIKPEVFTEFMEKELKEEKIMHRGMSKML
jgi:hypothetical protein